MDVCCVKYIEIAPQEVAFWGPEEKLRALLLLDAVMVESFKGMRTIGRCNANKCKQRQEHNRDFVEGWALEVRTPPEAFMTRTCDIINVFRIYVALSP